MAAGAALEARIGDPKRAVMADIDAVRAVAVWLLAEPAEGRMIDADRAVRIGGGEDAALAVDEHRLDDVEIALLDADAGAIAVADMHMGEDQPFDPRRAAAQHQDRLVLAHAAVEDRGARRRRDEGDPARLLDGAILVAARRDPDRALAAADRADRVLQAGEALAGLDDGERPGRPAREARRPTKRRRAGSAGTGRANLRIIQPN